ncbi:MAG: hypothetical protein C4551_10100 [Bacillota bacterium]|nr:MAG: hypothetical protein C4551_10100 [Bacillota bacterium]
MARTPTIPTVLLDKLCDVYTSDPATGAYTVLAKDDLPCRVAIVSAQGATSASERAELVSMRRLVWGPDYEMPERAQVEVAGERWNVVAGSLAAPTWPPSGGVVYRSCDLVRSS